MNYNIKHFLKTGIAYDYKNKYDLILNKDVIPESTVNHPRLIFDGQPLKHKALTPNKTPQAYVGPYKNYSHKNL